jgi:hypothetical protein
MTIEPTTASLTLEFHVAALQERVAVDLLRAINELVNDEIPEIVASAIEDTGDPPAALEVLNRISVHRPLEQPLEEAP